MTRKQNSSSKRTRVFSWGAILACVALAAPTFAADTVIDFESGFADVQPVGTVVTADNQVTFSVGPNLQSLSTAYVARVGRARTAFASGRGTPDTPADTSISGDYFLTDENNGPKTKFNYYLEFDRAVSSISLDLYDYRKDGGPRFGSTATLTAFSDSFGTSVGTDVFKLVRPNPVDGNIENLSIAYAAGIQSVSLVFDRGDVGTGIDNVTFATVPAPGALVLAGLGSGLVGWMRRRRLA